MTHVHCQNCGNKIGVQNDSGTWRVKHQGRDTLAPDIIEITCEDCGTTWRKGDPMARIQTVPSVRLATATYTRKAV
jgi:hypothetical protein